MQVLQRENQYLEIYFYLVGDLCRSCPFPVIISINRESFLLLNIHYYYQNIMEIGYQYQLSIFLVLSVPEVINQCWYF